ncbi:BgtAc-30459 [Blumeria graminis f. sp. tritici]|uniref:BgtAc-30459 n=1 Tax=Blumeria graminis f. sp. tritici TaxID=62690 RepID=A0A9X9QCI0_BLUGR|nr:BgtAc-30459 [Blumeria graminis f. sp. tritici]
MRKRHFYCAAVLLNICLHSHSTNVYPVPRKAEYLDEVISDYLCETTYFESKIVMNSYRTGCHRLWNADSNKKFPAKLEDNHFVNGAHRTLFSWPLNHATDSSDIRFTGIYRTVFDINCRFHGVVIRRENNHEDCIKFLDRKEFDNFGMKLEEYEIHKCDRAVFGETYLKASIKVACEASLNPRSNRYPLVHAESPSKIITYRWPLRQNDKIHESHRGSDYHFRYFVLYTHEGGPVRVIENGRISWQTCPSEKKIIPPSTYESNIIGALEGIVYEDKKSYECSGQVFTDKYIQEVFSKIKTELQDWSNNPTRRDKYPQLKHIGQENAVDMVWMWYLRIREADFMKSNERYVLAVDRNLESFNVFYVEDRKYTVCVTRYK